MALVPGRRQLRSGVCSIASDFYVPTSGLWSSESGAGTRGGLGGFASFSLFPIVDVVISYCYRRLILCWCIRFHYVVCNPVTNKWWLLPNSNHSFGSARLGFDPTVSSHFHVIEHGKRRVGESIGVSIYSSNSAA